MVQKLAWYISVSLLGCFAALAQVTTATLSGTVKDQSGAAVAGALVSVRNLATGSARSVNSSSTGEYVISNLQAGNYSVSANLNGFKTTTIPKIELQVAQRGFAAN